MHLDHPLRARLRVQPVDVLGHDRVQLPARTRARPAPAWAPLGSFSSSVGEPGPIEAPEALRVAVEGVDVGDLHRVDLLPQPLARGAEVGDPRGDRDPRRRSARRPRSPRGSARRARPPCCACRARSSDYFPCHFGVRLPRKALMPSLRVLAAERGREARLLLLDPLVEVGIVGGEPSPARPRAAPGRRACAPTRAPCRRARGRAPPGWRARRPRPRRERIASPIRFISSAFASPTSRGSRWVPPKPGMIPSLISGWPKTADSAAIRKLHAIASSQPPPKASELTAATVETRLRPRSRSSAWPEWISSSPSVSSICVNALMSAPAENTTGIEDAITSAPDLARALDPLPDRAEVLDHLGRDRVHRRVREPGDRDVAARLELHGVGLLALVGLRVGVEALAGLHPQAALGDKPLEHRRRREPLAVLAPRPPRASPARRRGRACRRP